MKYILRNILLLIFSLLLALGSVSTLSAVEEDPVYTTLRNIDLGTFNEYRYKITEQFFNLREHFQIKRELSIPVLQNIAKIADTGYKYLPDNLKNQNYLRQLLIDIKRGVESPGNEILYTEIIKSIANYIEEAEIQSVNGIVEISSTSGNAPLTVTLRAKVEDPSGTQISQGNYTWWIDSNGKKVVIGRGPSINYTFNNEGKYSIFLDVTSSHRNTGGYTDILPFRARTEITVNEKIASLVVKVNGELVGNKEELKFNPDDADYGLIFDATSSIPTTAAKFSKTEWDFGNGIRKSYAGSPRIERVRYATQGDYDVTLIMTTNEGKQVQKNFVVAVHDPIATIEVNREDGYIGDSFTFAAKSSGRQRDLTYNWEILDIDADKTVFQNSNKLFSYTFTNKGRYSVRLRVRQASGEIDQDVRIVYVTSQSPIAEFTNTIPASHKPNTVYFDASRSFDPDVSDDGKLKYNWFIDGNRINLENSNANGSVGYYTFDSVGTHSISLEVTDPDGITATKKGNIEIKSILSVDFYAFPRVVPRTGFIKLIAESKEAQVYEWDFGDGQKKGGNLDNITHTYNKSGAFNVILKVTDKENNTNTFKRTVYVSDSGQPFSLLDVNYDNQEKPLFDEKACGGSGAYIVNRVQNIVFDGTQSINVDGEKTNLEYSWKIGLSKYATSQSVTHRFDEIGCFPIKLTIKSTTNGAVHSSETMVSVENVLPTLTSLSLQIENPDADPLIVRVTAQGAGDPDGIIQSYLWYYYTDIDSQPQDFRSSLSNTTAFVIPKITGNYYFVAILKDNNEARITSEEITGARYFTTVTGDNINTPIVELSVNNTSTIIGEEVIFTAKAKNILGQDVGKTAEYSWDFDGDGFYDTQTKENTVSYVYKKSGEFYAKVKVKYKGISSTKNITMNVSNKLVADFGYMSIGSKFIFFDTSTGLVESRAWDLGDGTKKEGTSFEYTYQDKANSHIVKLKITEGTKIKEIEKTVTKNFKNIIKSRNGGLIVFTSPELDEGNKITLENTTESVFIYMGESDESTDAYVVDYDTEHDSDLNGGLDDDEDNSGTASYVSGSVLDIPLSSYKIQKVRIFLKDAAGNITHSQDFTIEKTYIEEKTIDPDTIIFEDVTESEKQKIEALKAILVTLPQQQRLEALSYVQKLQENWNDETEKTRTILDFENYIFELGHEKEDELISILESLLVEGQEDQSAKQITYQALVNLIPKDISCTTTDGTCYDFLISRLDAIKESSDITSNKEIGKEILEIIKTTELMDNSQKLDFKAILTSFVYGGNVDNIPDDEKQEVIDETPSGGKSSLTGVLGILLTILKWVGYIVVFFIAVVLLLFGVYKILNKDKNLSFSEYVTKITSFGKDNDTDSKQDTSSDILDILGEEDPRISDIFSSDATIDPLANTSSKVSAPIKEEVKEVKQEVPEEIKEEVSEVPDWLKGNFDTEVSISKPEPQAQIIEKQEDEETGFMTSVFSDTSSAQVEKNISEKSKNTQEQEPREDFDIEKETKLVPDDNVPDWLKGSFDTNVTVEGPEIKNEEEILPSLNVVPDTANISVKNEVVVPDWLKESMETPVEPQAEISKDISQDIQESIPKNTGEETIEVVDMKKSTPPKKRAPNTKKTVEKPLEDSLDTSDINKEALPEDTKAKNEELWDDGMKIPDWLKSDE